MTLHAPGPDPLPATTDAAHDLARATLLDAHGLDEARLLRGLAQALGAGGEHADLYLKSSVAESWSLEGGRVHRGSFAMEQGFGLRGLQGEQAVLATSQCIDAEQVQRAAGVVRGALGAGDVRGTAVLPVAAPVLAPITVPLPARYGHDDPVAGAEAAAKIALLETLDAAARGRDPRVVEVRATLSSARALVFIARDDGLCAGDVRPSVRLDLSVQVLQQGRRESASRTVGGRGGLSPFTPQALRQLAQRTVDAALGKLDARPAPAGVMSVVMGPGWNGVLLHEAVGHGLEADFNRRGASAFAGRIGERVAAPGVTIVDDGTLAGGRGSLHVDDEGTPGRCTTLIEDGILVGYINDRLSARLTGAAPTGNGRRESHDVLPLPRMTNTYLRAGGVAPEEIIASVAQGIYVAHLGGGQVDISSGRFVFNASEALLIEQGRLTAPLKAVTVLGDGPESLKKVRLIGHDLQIDAGAGLCVKAGQSLPVGVGQPTLRIDEMTVGGTG
mgnify:CR=1 FL=1